MANFKEAFAEARKDGKKTFDWNGKSYSTDVKQSNSSSRYESGALKGMRRDPFENETMAQRRQRLVEQERKLAASRPKPAEPKPSKSEAPAPKRPSASEILASGRKTEEGRKAGEREGVRKVASEAKQLPGRAVEGAMKAAGAPTHASIFAGTLLGNRSKITEADLDADAKAQLRKAAERATSGGRKGDIQYEDYDTPLRRGSLDRKQAAAQTVGRTGKGKTTREGSGYRIRDRYDFSNEDRNKEIDRYAKMGRAERAGTVVKETVKEAKEKGFKEAVKRVPSRLANAYIGRESREVDVKLARGGGIETKGKTKGRFV